MQLLVAKFLTSIRKTNLKMNTMKNLILITMLTLIGSCGSKSNKDMSNLKLSKENQKEIKTSLSSLLNRDNSDAFVIIEEPNSGKFVQFSGNSNEELNFSLPAQQMNEKELLKAKELLKNYGIQLEFMELFTDDSTKSPAGGLNEFSKKINNDIEQAVELVSLVMIDVFGFKANTELKIIEN